MSENENERERGRKRVMPVPNSKPSLEKRVFKFDMKSLSHVVGRGGL